MPNVRPILKVKELYQRSQKNSLATSLDIPFGNKQNSRARRDNQKLPLWQQPESSPLLPKKQCCWLVIEQTKNSRARKQAKASLMATTKIQSTASEETVLRMLLNKKTAEPESSQVSEKSDAGNISLFHPRGTGVLDTKDRFTSYSPMATTKIQSTASEETVLILFCNKQIAEPGK